MENLKPFTNIKTKEQYHAYCNELERITFSDDRDKYQDDADMLIALIEFYDEKNWLLGKELRIKVQQLVDVYERHGFLIDFTGLSIENKLDKIIEYMDDDYFKWEEDEKEKHDNTNIVDEDYEELYHNLKSDVDDVYDNLVEWYDNNSSCTLDDIDFSALEDVISEFDNVG